MRLGAILGVLLLAGCSTGGEVIHLARAGAKVQCGPYPAFGGRNVIIAQQNLRACVEDYQRQGYERVPGP